jgi:hypothetical protein
MTLKHEPVFPTEILELQNWAAAGFADTNLSE